jgi:hypothetical protein
MTRYRLAVAASLSALTLLVMAGCSSAASTSAPPTASPAKASPATASPSLPAGQRYASKAFVVPFTVTVGASLKSPPHLDSRNLLFWDAADGSDSKVRFLVPVNLYRPGSPAPQAPPKDYLAYLRGLTSQGAKLSDVTTVTVDGHPATLMSATSATDQGSLGCAKAGADPAGEGCFGVQPDLILRIAVIPVGNSTLLAWARTNKTFPDPGFLAKFETMLKSVRFR